MIRSVSAFADAHLGHPHMIDTVKKMFRQPTPVEMALRELQEARLARLEAQSAVDFARSVVDYNNARIIRLEAFLEAHK